MISWLPASVMDRPTELEGRRVPAAGPSLSGAVWESLPVSEAIVLMEQASNYRLLASLVTDKAARVALITLAEKCEAQALAIVSHLPPPY